MAGRSPRSLHWSGLPWLLLLLVVPMAAATQLRVGGSMGWRVPDPNAESYNHWAEKNRFHIGDSLLFVYPAGNDSVLQVSKEDYDGCNTGNPIAKFDDGNTVIHLNHSGPLFFISGVPGSCNNNQKMVVVVMGHHGNVSAPPPSPEPVSPPAPSPPPPAAPIEIVPSSSPPQGEATPPPPNAAAPVKAAVGMVGSVGVLLGSLVFFVV